MGRHQLVHRLIVCPFSLLDLKCHAYRALFILLDSFFHYGGKSVLLFALVNVCALIAAICTENDILSLTLTLSLPFNHSDNVSFAPFSPFAMDWLYFNQCLFVFRLAGFIQAQKHKQIEPTTIFSQA